MSQKNRSVSSPEKRPIGIFDSGVGGLTIVREIRKILPHEDLVYYGDMAHLPYGTKSREQIIRFSQDNAKFLQKKKVKAIVVACNSSSSASLETLENKFPSIPFFDVIYPATKEALKLTKRARIGVIATHATVETGAYRRALTSLDSKVTIFQQACPLFVSFVEEGIYSGEFIRPIIEAYLKPLVQKKVDVLILGCTHYPLLKSTIQAYLGKNVKVIDSARPTARMLAEGLELNDLERSGKRRGKLEIFVTDKPRNFTRIAEKFLKEKIAKVELVR